MTKFISKPAFVEAMKTLETLESAIANTAADTPEIIETFMAVDTADDTTFSTLIALCLLFRFLQAY